MDIKLKDTERIDDLQLKGLKLIQDTNGFCFGIDAVLLANFAKVKKDANVADLGTGTGIIPILIAGKSKAKKIVGVEIQEEVYEMATRSVKLNNLEDRVVVSSFNHYSIKKCMDINNKVKVGALVDSCIYEPQDYINSIGADCYHPEFNSLNKEVVKKLKDKNIKINTYTVNKEKDLKNMIDLKVDMIITNYPKKLKELLEM